MFKRWRNTRNKKPVSRISPLKDGNDMFNTKTPNLADVLIF